MSINNMILDSRWNEETIDFRMILFLNLNVNNEC